MFHLYGYPGRFPLLYFFFNIYLQINELRLWETLSLSLPKVPQSSRAGPALRVADVGQPVAPTRGHVYTLVIDIPPWPAAV